LKESKTSADEPTMKLLLLGSFLFNEGKISREEKHLLKVEKSEIVLQKLSV